MERATYDFLALGGGQNDGPAASHIADNELAACVNFYPYGQVLVRRNGVEQITRDAAGYTITTPFAFKDNETGEWTLFGFTPTGLVRVDGVGFATVPIGDANAIPSDTTPWCVEQYRNVGYAMRTGIGRLRRFGKGSIESAGIDKPTSAPTLAQGSSGSLTAGAYKGVVTYYNKETDAESDPSDAGSVTIAASKKIDWSAIPIPTVAGQITSRRLYRTLTDQQGEYFFVAQIDDLSTTTYTDDVVSSNLGRAVSFRNGIPPIDNLEFMRFWKERCWLANKSSVYFSELGLPESFWSSSKIQIFPDDGSSIRALYGWGDRFIIGKDSMVAYLIGTDESDFAVSVLSEKHGISSHHSVKSAEGNLIWFGRDNFYRSSGEAPVAISTYKVRNVVDAIPDDETDQVYAALYPKHSWYLASVPQTGGSRKVLAYNYKTDAWSVFEHADAVSFLAESIDSDGAQTVFCTAPVAGPQHLYRYDSGNTDWGNSITARIRTKAHSFGRSAKLSAVEMIRLLCTTVGANATLRVYRNLSSSAVKSRTVYLGLDQMWKDYAFSHRGTPGTLLQVEVEYTGTLPIEIEGVSVEVLHTDRRTGRAA